MVNTIKKERIEMDTSPYSKIYTPCPTIAEHDFLRIVPEIARGMGFTVVAEGFGLKVKKIYKNILIVPDNLESKSEVEVRFLPPDFTGTVMHKLKLERLVEVLANIDKKHKYESSDDEDYCYGTRVESPINDYEEPYNVPDEIFDPIEFEKWYKYDLKKTLVGDAKNSRKFRFNHVVKREYIRQGDDYCGTIYGVVIASAKGWTTLILEAENYGSCPECDSFEEACYENNIDLYWKWRLSNLHFKKVCRDDDLEGIVEIFSEYDIISKAMEDEYDLSELYD